MLCGSTRFLTVDHRDGDEHNDDAGNLRWLCKSCNTRLGLAMARTGQGRRTRQYNPPATGAASLGEYVSALHILHGEMTGDFDTARQTIHNTPAPRRSDFAKEIWRRRKRGGAGGLDLVRLLTGG